MHYLCFIFGLLFIVFIILLLHIKNLPNTYRVECALRTSVPAETLYNYIKDFENWSEWNTLIKEDSTMKLQFKNIGTENPSYSWDGEKRNRLYGNNLSPSTLYYKSKNKLRRI